MTDRCWDQDTYNRLPSIGTVILQCVTIKIRHNIPRIKPYKSDTNIKYINILKCVTMSTYDHHLYNYVLY